ncbi:hypothetical protein HPTD01_2498 [Halomonas sp. TD01]|nr:hypothetical protein HPTD01_2498 [Halomonas sp. TD01]
MIHVKKTTTLNYTNAHFSRHFGKLSVYNAIGADSLDAVVVNGYGKRVIGASDPCLQNADVHKIDV